MEHRQRDQIAVGTGEWARARHQMHLQRRTQDPFRGARGAGSIDHAQSVPWLDLPLRRRQGVAVAAQRTSGVQDQAGGHLAGIAHHDDVGEFGARHVAQALDQSSVGDHQPRAGILDDVRQETASIAGVDRHIDRAQIVQRQHHRQAGAPVRQPHGDEVALRDSQTPQGLRAAPDLRAQLSAGQGRAVGEDGARVVRDFPAAPVYRVADDAFVLGGHTPVEQGRLSSTSRRRGRNHRCVSADPVWPIMPSRDSEFYRPAAQDRVSGRAGLARRDRTTASRESRAASQW
jgi:hypothetical protein